MAETEASLARGERLARDVEDLWAGGPPERGVVVVIRDGEKVCFRARALALTCEGCGVTIPQSRTRVSPDARRAWVRHHALCTDEELLASK